MVLKKTYSMILLLFSVQDRTKAAAATAKLLQSCPTLRPHRRQPTRLLCPWDSPGKNTGVGCHFLLQQTAFRIYKVSNKIWPTVILSANTHGTICLASFPSSKHYLSSLLPSFHTHPNSYLENSVLLHDPGIQWISPTWSSHTRESIKALTWDSKVIRTSLETDAVR